MKFSDYFNINGIVHGFFLFFFIFFLHVSNIRSLVVEPITSWHIVFNIGVWFVLTMFCMNGFIDSAANTEARRLKREAEE